jgi:hypothetical protein
MTRPFISLSLVKKNYFKDKHLGFGDNPKHDSMFTKKKKKRRKRVKPIK